jgi:hypothetical protein
LATAALKPGDMNVAPGQDDLDNSMALAIDNELDRLMQADGLPGLSSDMSDRIVRDRRRLFVAIARGVIMHIKANADAVTITTAADGDLHPTIDTVGVS